MKYYKASKFPKTIGSTGFIAIAACALIAVGAITWFALSRNQTNTIPPTVSNTPSYPDTNNSYNSQVDEIPQQNIEEPATDVNESMEDIPYEEQPIIEEQKITYILPVTGSISKGYSDTALQYSATYGDMRLHTGVDILCDVGSDIKAAASGTVKSVVDDANLGKIITIEHSEEITVKYCGMGSVNVKEGDKVSAADVIGTSGEIPSECADNPHIHIEVMLDGNTTSPLAALGLE